VQVRRLVNEDENFFFPLIIGKHLPIFGCRIRLCFGCDNGLPTGFVIEYSHCCYFIQLGTLIIKTVLYLK
jgi:hypothetical protein